MIAAPGPRHVLDAGGRRPENGAQHWRHGQLGGAVQHEQNLPSAAVRRSRATDAKHRGCPWLGTPIGNTSYLSCEINRHRNRAARGSCRASDGRTRDAVARLVQQSGPLTAAALAERLQLSPAAVRRHLDALVADGSFAEVQPRVSALRPRGRGRPARAYALTDAGRAKFGHAYDDLASTALRYLRDTGGEQPRCWPSPSTGRPRSGRPDPRPGWTATRHRAGRHRYRQAGRAGRRGADRGGLRRQRGTGRPGHPDLPAPLPGGARGRRVPGTVRGRDPGAGRGDGHLRPTAGHHRPRRRGLHHARPNRPESTGQPRHRPQHGRQFSDHCSRAHQDPGRADRRAVDLQVRLGRHRRGRCRRASAGSTPTWCATSRR